MFHGPTFTQGRRTVSDLRCGQPPVRDGGCVHQAFACLAQGSVPICRGQGTQETRRTRPVDGVHPEPDVRGGGPAGRAQGLLRRQQPRRQVTAGDDRPADAVDSGVQGTRCAARLARPAGRARHHHDPDIGESDGRATQGRSRAHHGGGAGVQRVAVRRLDVQLRGPHFRHPDRHAVRAGRGHRRAGGCSSVARKQC